MFMVTTCWMKVMKIYSSKKKHIAWYQISIDFHKPGVCQTQINNYLAFRKKMLYCSQFNLLPSFANSIVKCRVFLLS